MQDVGEIGDKPQRFCLHSAFLAQADMYLVLDVTKSFRLVVRFNVLQHCISHRLSPQNATRECLR